VKHLLPRPQQRLLSQLRSNSNFYVDDDDDDDDGPDAVDFQIGFRKPELEKVLDQQGDLDQDDLSDYVIVRLAVARARAMERYRELNG
jgi:hypothetical protein